MTLRRDHVAGAFFIAAGLLVWALSGDLPVGTLAFPGAGMMPKLVTAIMIALAVVVLLAARSSPALAEIDWADGAHAARVMAVAIPAVALYTTAGFPLTMTAMLFALLALVERKHWAVAAGFSAGIAGLAYVLFGTFLKSPLPAGVFGY